MATKKNNTTLRFIFTGLAATAIDFSILGIITYVGFEAIFANIIATSCAFVFSFFVNRAYTFQAKNGNIARQMVLFTVVTLTGVWGLQSIVLHLGIPFTNTVVGDAILALFIVKVIATGISMIWNYLLYKTVVFKQKELA